MQRQSHFSTGQTKITFGILQSWYNVSLLARIVIGRHLTNRESLAARDTLATHGGFHFLQQS
jgi:hypothetical protein